MIVGDIVKNFDFDGLDDCYLLGRVVSVGKSDDHYRAELISRVWCGKVDSRFKFDFFSGNAKERTRVVTTST